MKAWFLPFKIESPSIRINYRDKILLTGSCFSENIGNKLSDMKFNILQQPNGVIYDPLSIYRSLNSYINEKKYTAEDIFESGGLWHSWDHHSDFSGICAEDVLLKINEKIADAGRYIREAGWLFITFGSAWYYRLKKSGDAVANCHKVVAEQFTRELLRVSEIVSGFAELYSGCKTINPNLKIVLTVSPVRHIRDGLVGNNQSKGRLIDAVQQLVNFYPDVFYFPSYELMIDVLRDYRFYKKDMIHPSEEAVDHLFEILMEAYLDAESKEIFTAVEKWRLQKNHRVMHNGTESQIAFDKKLEQLTVSLRLKYPFLEI